MTNTMFATGDVDGMGPLAPLPPLPLRQGIFTDVVPELEGVFVDGANRVGMGAKWITRDALHVTVTALGDPCDWDAEPVTFDEIVLGTESTAAFSFHQTLSCSTIGGMGMPEINQMLDSDYDAIRSEALMAGLTTNITGTTNFVSDSTSVTGGTIVPSIAAIEDALADRISNLRGYIFVPITLLAPAVAAGAIKMINGQMQSPAGHLVVADAGHVAQNTLYGTGAIAWAISSTGTRTG
jgi:hypothetical protein